MDTKIIEISDSEPTSRSPKQHLEDPAQNCQTVISPQAEDEAVRPVDLVPIKAEEIQDEFASISIHGRAYSLGKSPSHDFDHDAAAVEGIVDQPSGIDPINADGEPLTLPYSEGSRQSSSRMHSVKRESAGESEETKKLLVSFTKEDGPIELKHVTLIKTEDGKLDMWSLEQFDLRPGIKVEEKYHVGSTRKVIADRWSPDMHKQLARGQITRDALCCLQPRMELPLAPGKHGIVFATQRSMGKCDGGTPIIRPIDLFVGNKANEWQYTGSYQLTRSDEISPHQLELLPQVW
ncbi:hypothetical protein F5I97DRAFT_1827967 [Phlebopus sp. FC_14]|nr:hypothetical protein F5I97DRAFT_1827967 [Phlebopus sp. FC_14]